MFNVVRGDVPDCVACTEILPQQEMSRKLNFIVAFLNPIEDEVAHWMLPQWEKYIHKTVVIDAFA